MDVLDLQRVRSDITRYIETAAIDRRVLDTLRFGQGFTPKECELWDYKRAVDTGAIGLAKTVLQAVSFHNTYGGYLIYGVAEIERDRTFTPLGILKGSLDSAQLRTTVRNYTGEMIDVTFVELDYEVDGAIITLGVLHVPKRNAKATPVFFGKNGPQSPPAGRVFLEHSVYLRRLDQCLPATSKEDFQLLFSARENPYLWTAGDPEVTVGSRSVIADHNLPDRQIICPKFVGRDAIISELWRWLADDFSFVKVLAGDGGKGKTSIAYEFAEELCRSRPYDIGKVIWLTAKARQFRAQADEYVAMPEAHYSDVASFLVALAGEIAVLPEEVEGASLALLKKTVRSALREIPCFIVVDDLDSTANTDQRAIIEVAQHLAGSSARFLLTTRMDFGLGSALRVGGLELGDYQDFVAQLAGEFGLHGIKRKNVEELHHATDGSPLFTESLFRLCRNGVPLGTAIHQWKGKLGSEVRDAALKREVAQLSPEGRTVLVACALMREAAYSELKQVVAFNDERMHGCLQELARLFLVGAPQFIKDESRFTMSNNTRLLVLENQRQLVTDPARIERSIRKVRGKDGTRKPVRFVGNAILQARALARDHRFDDAIGTIDAAARDAKGHPDLMLARGWCYLTWYRESGDAKHLRQCRSALRASYDKGQRKADLYEAWYDAEGLSDHSGGQVDVAGRALEAGGTDKALWFRRRAMSYIKLAHDHEGALNKDLARDDLAYAARDLAEAITLSKGDEEGALRKVVEEVADWSWRLTFPLHTIPDARSAFDIARAALRFGDRRPVAYVRALEAVDRLIELLNEQVPLSLAQANLLQQVVREVGEELTRGRMIEGDAALRGRVQEQRSAADFLLSK